jgi:LPS export ABC transporter protein LptC
VKRTHRTRLITTLLAAVVVIAVGSIVTVFYRVRQAEDLPEKLMAVIPENTEIALGSLEHTATRGGKTQWRLKAETARVMDGKTTLMLTNPQVVFYMDDGREVVLTADQGILETRSNNIAATGNVVINNRDYSMKTEALRYSHDERKLTSDRRVFITGAWADLSADRMHLDLNADTVEFTGRVEGAFTRGVT